MICLFKNNKTSNMERTTEDEDKFKALIRESAELMINQNSGSTSLLQRRFTLGYAKAGRIVDCLENLKIIGPFRGIKERKILVTKKELENILKQNNL